MKIDFTATASYAQDKISADKLRGALQLSKARVCKKVVKQLVEKDKFVKNQATFDFSPLEVDSRRMNLGIGDGGDRSNQRGHSFHSNPYSLLGKLPRLPLIQTAAREKEMGEGNCARKKKMFFRLKYIFPPCFCRQKFVNNNKKNL